MESTNDLLPLLTDTNERFRRIRELGSGTYGRVLLALDRDLQQRCALKILPKSTTIIHYYYLHIVQLSVHMKIVVIKQLMHLLLFKNLHL